MFQLVDCFFFISLGITFLLLFLMAFHFKTRISSLEKKNDALAEMCTTIVAKISQVKQMVVAQNTMPPNIFFHNKPNPVKSEIEIIEIQDSDSDSDSESESESESDDDSEDDDKTEGKQDQDLVVQDLVVQDLVVEDLVFEDLVDEDLVFEDLVDEDLVVHDLVKEEEEVHVEEKEPIPLEVDVEVQSEVFSLAINHDDKNSFKKMSVQMLRTLAISKGLSIDPSKMKKPELLKILSDSSEIDVDTLKNN